MNKNSISLVRTQHVKFRAKCTACGKIVDLTNEQIREGFNRGSMLSICCQAVVTAVRVTVARKRVKK